MGKPMRRTIMNYIKLPSLSPDFLVNAYAYVAPYVTPIPSALHIAGHISSNYADQNIQNVAWWGSLIGYEAAGGICIAAMILSANRKKWGTFWVCLGGVFLYAISAWLILNLDASFGMPLYIALGVFAVYSSWSWSMIKAEDKRLDEQKQKELEAQKLHLKKIRAETRLQKMQNANDANGMQTDAKNAEISILHTCEWCKDTFVDPKKYAAHKRWCKDKPNE